MTSPTTSTQDILSKAADLISKPGAWGQGRGRRNRLCAVDAIVDAGGGMATVVAVYGYLGIDSLTQWNDAPGRTQSEVVAVLRQASASTSREG